MKEKDTQPDKLLFGKLFFGLRQAGVKVGVGEWMSLMQALSEGAIGPSLRDFYAAGRALLVKHESLFDTWDQVFEAVFGEGELPAPALDRFLEWLADPALLRTLSPEEIEKLEALPLEKLRELFEERLREQAERHDGGNRYIGTGGTSPFGRNGINPAGVRVGGGGGQKSAIQVAGERRYRDYRNDRVLDTRALAVALKKLRLLRRESGEPELDVEESIDQTCKNAGELSLVFRPPRKNEAKVLLLMDTGGSMDPYTHLVEQLFSAASGLNAWKKFEAFFFHNCPYEVIYSKFATGEGTATGEFLKERPRDTFLIMVGDADMAPTELIGSYGAIAYSHMNRTTGIAWLHRIRTHFHRSVWLNPLPPRYWQGSYTIQRISRLFPMFPLTVEGIEQAVDHLRKQRPDPIPELDSLTSFT